MTLGFLDGTVQVVITPGHTGYFFREAHPDSLPFEQPRSPRFFEFAPELVSESEISLP